MKHEILDEQAIIKLERKLSDKYGMPIQVSVKQDRSLWYNVEKLTLDLKYMSKDEFEACAQDERCLASAKILSTVIGEIIKNAKDKE